MAIKVPSSNKQLIVCAIVPWVILLTMYGSLMVNRIQEPATPPYIERFRLQQQQQLLQQKEQVSDRRAEDDVPLLRSSNARTQSEVRSALAADVGSPSATHCLDVGNYHRWFVNVLIDNFGRIIAEAVYDPDLFNDMVSTLKPRGDGTYHWDLDDEFVLSRIDEHPTHPAPFHSTSNMLWWGKRWTSVALSKISRDAELEKLFERVCTDADHGVKLALFEKTVMQAMNAQVQYFHTILQLIIDVTLNNEKRQQFTNLVKDYPGMDTLVLVSGWIRAETKVSDLESLFIGSNSNLETVVNGRLEVAKKEVSGKDSQPNFPLRYDDKPYDQSMPYNGKFWTMLRPTAGCSTLTRMCENAEGCRLLCNPEYLLYAGRRGKKDATTGLSSPISSSAPTPYHHRVIGMGCNNEYDWDISFLSLFNGAAGLSHGKTHRLGFLTTMDCTITIGPGNRQWRVPQILKDAPIGFSGASVCAAARTAGHELGPRELKAFQLRTEATWTKPVAHDHPIVRFNAHPDALAAVERRGDDPENKEFLMEVKTFQGKPLPSPRWFDAVSVLKIDVEGSEWKYIPAWIRGELQSIRTNTPAGTFAVGSTSSIDFATAAPDFFTVSLFSLEFHRIGVGEPPGYTVSSALRSHWLALQTYGLGFIMVAHEKNEWGHCCYENTYVHVRHFVKSEMWMTLKDSL